MTDGAVLYILSANGPMTSASIARLKGDNPNHIRKRLYKMRRNKDVHIAAWEYATPGRVSPSYAAGPGIDAIKPIVASLTHGEHQARYVEKRSNMRDENRERKSKLFDPRVPVRCYGCMGLL